MSVDTKSVEGQSDPAMLTIMPVSVIDMEAQGKRKNENHSSTSSRANYSPFPEEVAILCYEFFLRDSQTIFDPFAGWGERGFFARKYGKSYIGYDTSDEALFHAAGEYCVFNTKANSLFDEIPSFDGLITCPPYWNLEKYADESGIDRMKTWSAFLKDYEQILTNCYAAAAIGSTFCIMVGDWRKNHIYYDLEFHTSSIFRKLGATTIDKLVVSRKKISKIKIMLPQAKRLGYSVRVHENLLVFKKSAQ